MLKNRNILIYDELDNRADLSSPSALKYRGLIDSSFDSIQKYLEVIKRYFYHFTDHSVNHSIRILNNIGSLLTKEQIQSLADIELYFIIATALLHDIGMVISESEIRDLINDPDFHLERKAILKKNELNYENDWYCHGIERLIVVDYYRRRHGIRANLVINSGIMPCGQITGNINSLKKWIGVICAGHQVNREEICNSEIYPSDVLIDSQHVNVQFLTICLRLGDLLDITTERASPDLRFLSEPLVTLSKAHWDQYTEIEVRNLAPGKSIEIAGISPSQEAERVLREWIDYLEKECEQAALILNCGSDKYHIRLGRVEYKVKPKISLSGIPLYEFQQFRFNLDEERVFCTFLGKRLYGRTDVILRELVQNAIDAIRVRIAFECSKKLSWNTLSSDEQERLVKNEINLRRDDLAIWVSLEEIRDDSGAKTFWLKIKDAGIGMSRDVISEYLLKVGRTRWKEDSRLSTLKIGTIGEFGIGFLSTFLISDRTVVTTQSFLPKESGIQATIYSWKGYLSTVPINLDSPGTEIALLLKPDVLRDGFNIEEFIDFWFPFLEVPIKYKILTNPEKKLDSLAANTRIPKVFVFKFPDSESAIGVRQTPEKKGQDRPPVSQDGITVRGVVAPSINIPAQEILNKLGILVDLRGKDRLPLTMSRDLFDEDAKSFWDRITPRVWDGLVLNHLDKKQIHDAYARLCQAEFENSFGNYVFALGPSDGIYRGPINSLSTPKLIKFQDLESRNLKEYRKFPEQQIILLPNVPSPIYIGAQYRYFSEITDLKRYMKIHCAEFSDIEYSPEKLDVITTWAYKGRSTVYSNLSWASLAVLNKYLKFFMNKFRYVTPVENNLSALSSELSSLSLERLCFLKVSMNWYALRNPINGEWFGLNKRDLDQIRNINRPKSLADYVCLLMLGGWPEPTAWGGSNWDQSSIFAKLGEQFADQLAHVGVLKKIRWLDQSISLERKGLDYDYDDDDDDDDESISRKREESKIYEDDDIAYERFQGGDAITVSGTIREINGIYQTRQDEWAELFNTIITDVLPHIDTGLLDAFLTPWEQTEWQKGTKKGDSV